MNNKLEHARSGSLLGRIESVAIYALVLAIASSGALRADGPPLYNRDIRPILAENCFACHGPDSAARKADLRLDKREDAIKSEAIVPGKPDESGLVERIFSDEPSKVMPPPKSHKKLTPVQKETLKRWISAGAEYQLHWSLIAPKRPALPVVKNSGWVRNPIDNFILADLEERGLAPAPEADRRTLAITYIQTGNQVTGRPCLGAWASYGLGSLNQNLPTFVMLVAKPTNQEQLQAISARLWSSGYLPGEHAGVSFRSAGDPILFINNPPGVSPVVRRTMLDAVKNLNEMNYKAVGDPETHTRIQQYEMAFRMQSSVPELTDFAREPASTFQLYGDEAKTPGTFANTALLARRLVERGVRFVQIYHNNWDMHFNVTGRMPDQCRDVDQPCYALIQDLKRRGLLESTLVIWGGEFGRTIYSQGGLTKQNYGRDHHPRCFTMWLAGGGSRPGQIYGETDDFSYNIVKDPVHIRDFHATVLHLLGFDHQRFSYRYQGLDQRLTGVEPAKVIKELLA